MKKISAIDRKYENFRWFLTSNNILVIGGKSDEQNELALMEFSSPHFSVLHTSEPGSPFCVLNSEKPGKKDIEEAAIFCACFSQQWKLGKKEISVDIFKREQIYKKETMKLGTFGVKGDKKTIKVKPKLYLVIQNGRLRAVPDAGDEKKLAEIKQGNMTKEQASDKIAKIIKDKFRFPISKEEIMSAIPSDRLDIK